MQSKLHFLLFVLTFVICPDIYANSSDEIDEIKVTATRRPTNSDLVSAAVTSLREDSFVPLVTDRFSFKPGVYLQQTTPGQGQPIVRGQRGSAVLHLIDGTRVNNAIYRSGPTQYFALIDNAFLEQAEVQRGAASVLHGSDAMGGVVNVITRKPTLSAEDHVTGEFNTALDTANLAQSVDLTIEKSSERFGALVTAAYRNFDNRKIGNGTRVPSAHRMQGFRTAFSFEPNEKQRWLLDLQFTEQPETPRVDELIPGFGETQPASSEFFFAPNERRFARFSYGHKSGWWNGDWELNLLHQTIVDDRSTRGFNSDQRRLEENESDLFGLSIDVSKDIGETQWLWGFEAYSDRVSSSRVFQSVSTLQVTPTDSRFPDGSGIDQWALFGKAYTPLNDRLSFAGGLRWSQIEIDLASNSTIDDNLSISDVSAEAGLVYQWSKQLQLVANLGRGFRAPNIFDLGTLGPRPGNRFNIPSPSLDQEFVNQFDLGMRIDGDDLSGEVFVYLLSYRDRIASVDTGDLDSEGRQLVQNRNVSRSEVYGVETALSWQALDALRFGFVSNYTFAEDTTNGETSPGDRIPPWHGEISATYENDIAWRFKSFLQFAAAQNRLSDRDIRDNRIDPNGTSGWMTLNFELGYDAERWSTQIKAENVFDRSYRHHGSGVDAVGRNLSAQFQLRF